VEEGSGIEPHPLARAFWLATRDRNHPALPSERVPSVGVEPTLDRGLSPMPLPIGLRGQNWRKVDESNAGVSPPHRFSRPGGPQGPVQSKNGALGGIRTHTDQGLSLAPLPIGLRGHKEQSGRTLGCRSQHHWVWNPVCPPERALWLDRVESNHKPKDNGVTARRRLPCRLILSNKWCRHGESNPNIPIFNRAP
jgi:hypothetical protein